MKQYKTFIIISVFLFFHVNNYSKRGKENNNMKLGYPCLSYDGIERKVTQYSEYEKQDIDSLLSVLLEDKLPISKYDGARFTIRLKMRVRKNGQPQIIKFLTPLPKDVKNDIRNIMDSVTYKIVGGELPNKYITLIKVRLDFISYPSDIKTKLFK